MLKKKLKPNSILTKHSNVVPLKKKLPKAPVEEDEIEDEELTEEEVENVEEDDDEVEETPVVKKKLVPKSQRVVEEDDEDETEEEEPLPRRKAGLGSKPKGKSALAKAFDSVPLSNSAKDIPAGKYECIIKEAVVRPFSEEKGQFIIFRYDFCAPPHTGKSMTQFFKILDENEEPVDWMINMLKEAFARLGVEIEGDDLESTIQEINDSRPGILLKVGYQVGKDNVTYPRLAVQGTCDNDVVEAYKDSVPL